MIGMKGSDILRIVDALHRERGVDKEIIFMGIEAALLSAAKKKLGMEKNIVIEISRDTGEIRNRLGRFVVDDIVMDIGVPARVGNLDCG